MNSQPFTGFDRRDRSEKTGRGLGRARSWGRRSDGSKRRRGMSKSSDLTRSTLRSRARPFTTGTTRKGKGGGNTFWTSNTRPFGRVERVRKKRSSQGAARTVGGRIKTDERKGAISAGKDEQQGRRKGTIGPPHIKSNMIGAYEIKSEVGGKEWKGIGVAKRGAPGHNGLVDTSHPGLKVSRKRTHRPCKVRRGSPDSGQTIRIKVSKEGARSEEGIGAILSKKVGKTKVGGGHDEGRGKKQKRDREYMCKKGKMTNKPE